MRPRKRKQHNLLAAAQADLNPSRTPRWMREYVRTHLLPSVVQRLFDIGMGTTRFEQTTMVGKVIQVPASPAVQVRALDSLKLLGVPQQLGLADDDGNTLPGVLVMPPLELDATREIAHASMHGAPALEYVEADDTPEINTSVATAPILVEDTINPTLVSRLRARRSGKAANASKSKGRP